MHINRSCTDFTDLKIHRSVSTEMHGVKYVCIYKSKFVHIHECVCNMKMRKCQNCFRLKMYHTQKEKKKENKK